MKTSLPPAEVKMELMNFLLIGPSISQTMRSVEEEVVF
jgi:hypothetical protein